MSDREDSRRALTVVDGEALKPCPFCASTNLVFYEHVFAREFAVACNRCGAEGPKRPAHPEAARLWNGRIAS
jgi:Lar family restriction alleviation protein